MIKLANMKSLLLALFTVVSCATAFAQLHEVKPPPKHHYTGMIAGKYKFLMNLYFDSDNEGNVDGEYRYYTQTDFLQVKGKLDRSTSKFTLAESVYNWKKQEEQITGYFEGTTSGNAVNGTWFNKDRTKKYNFTLSTDEKPSIIKSLSDNSKTEDELVVTDTIVVRFNDNRKQVLTGFRSEVSTGVDYLTLEDINFDGYLDILVVEMTGAKNTPYIYWVFNPQTNKFVYHEELAATDPVVDVQHQQIVSDWADGAAIHGTDKYIWSAGDAKFYLIESTETDLSTNKTTVKKYKVENGKSVKL